MVLSFRYSLCFSDFQLFLDKTYVQIRVIGVNEYLNIRRPKMTKWRPKYYDKLKAENDEKTAENTMTTETITAEKSVSVNIKVDETKLHETPINSLI